MRRAAHMHIRAIAVVAVLALLSCWGGNAVAQAHEPAIFIAGNSGFADAITAAFIKKKVPALVVLDKAHAEYILQAAAVASKDESGAGKIARCMFMNCIGMNGYSSVSVELIRMQDSAVVWAYQVRKGNSGPVAIQSLSEAIAKHLKHDYLDKHNEY